MGANPLLLSQDEANPGTTRAVPLQTTLQAAKSNNGINQIRGTAAKNATSFGVPKHVTNVGASVSTAAKGSTSTVRVNFHRDPTDKSYSATAIWVKGYQGNSNPVQVASSYESPATFVLNNTGEPVSVVAQATGNSGQAPLNAAPTTGIRLPKSTAGGYGTSSTVYINSSRQTVTATKWMVGAGVFGAYQPAMSLGYFGTTANVVYLQQFSIPFSLTVSTLDGWFESANSGNTTIDIGIYNLSGNLLVSSGSWVLPHNSSLNNQTKSVNFTINPGTYYLGWCDSQPHQVIGIANPFVAAALSTNVLGANMTPPLYAVAANAGSSGVLPSTTGAFTAGWPDNTVVPAILFR